MAVNSSWLVLGFLISLCAHAAALTYRVEPNQKACFYTTTLKADEKIAFYFAVQSGGSFDIDYVVKDPLGQVIVEGSKEQQGDFILNAKQEGEYSFCFVNEMSTFAEKVVNFEIIAEHDPQGPDYLITRNAERPDQASKIDQPVQNLAAQLSAVSRTQKYFRTRENRNLSTVKSTESRIVWLSIIECLMMVAIGCFQVFVVRQFFSKSRRGYV